MCANVNNKENDISTRKKNQAKEIADVLGAEIKSHGATLWGLFNGVTYYTNHVANKDKTEDYVMLGAGYDKNKKAFDEIMSYVNEIIANEDLTGVLK